MPTFRSLVELQNELQKDIESALDKVTDKTFETLYNFINEEIYIKKTLKIEPSISSFGYDQTGEFLNALKRTSVINTSKGCLKATIYFDYRQMKPKYNADKFYNSHMSLSGEPSSSLVPLFLDLGIDSPTFFHNGIKFWDFIQKWLDINFNRLMKIELAKKGIKIK